jgi:GT2 family glycosyltransferase
MSLPSRSDPGLGVLVITWNRAELLRRCLRSIVDDLGEGDELIVVDNGSTDHTAAVLAEFPVARVVRLPENLGCPQGRNVGMAEATAPWVFSVDDDGWVAPGMLDRVRRTVAVHPDAAVIAGSYVTEPHLSPAEGYPAPAFRFCGGVAAIRRDWFERCGGYPSDGLRQGEERDLAFRIYEAGGHVLHDPTMTVVHAADTSDAHRQVVIRNAVRQDLTTTLRYFPVALLALAVPTKLFRFVRAARPRRMTGEVVAGVGDVWRDRRAILRVRRSVSWRTIGASLSVTDRWRRQAAGLR